VTVSPHTGKKSWFSGRFLDGELTLVLSEMADPGPGYAVNPITGRIWRNGEYVGDAYRLRYDRNALGWWVEYWSWRGSPLDRPMFSGEAA
jgi:hypothetical protein